MIAPEERREPGPRRFTMARPGALWKSLDRADIHSAARFSVFDAFLV